ncbi:inositol monophosphatase family protein [Solemya velesiana gill symbiont]|nr:inositol monophosphatase family protein [Solemya velesiana gill symbiont]
MMNKQEIHSRDLQQLVVEVADKEIMARFLGVDVHQKTDGSLVTDADLAAQEAIRERLQARWPAIPLLGEEMEKSEQERVLDTGEYWCLDPLDGTTNYACGIPFFAISLALIRDGRIVLGIVYDPVRKECFRADLGGSAYLNDEKLRLPAQPQSLDQCVAIVDFKRLSRELTMRLAGGAPYRSQRSLGAVTLEWCWLAAGRGQLYLHGSQKPWDYAAGLLIFQEAGGEGCLMDALGSDCISPASQVASQAAVGAAEQGLLLQWREWLDASEPD